MPCVSVEAYRNAPYWGFFTNIQCDISGIDGIDGLDLRISSSDGHIAVEGAEGMTIRIYATDGRPVANNNLAEGIFMVKVGDFPARKVVVTR